MTEITKIILTAGTTLLGGVFLFCATSLLQRLLFEPVIALRKTLGDVSYCLQYHAWVFHQSHPTVSQERFEKVFEELRSITSRMRADANAIFCYELFVRLAGIPKYPDLIEAAGSLIRVSNNLGCEKWDEVNNDLRTVERLLRIDIGRPRYKRKAERNRDGTAP